MSTLKEEWRAVYGFEEIYKVSSFGRIRSLDRTITRKDGKPLKVKGKLLNLKPNSRGYERVSLCDSGTSTWSTVHSIVAKTFLTKPEGVIGSRRGQYCVNHKDGNKLNNNVSNLEYVTILENYNHAKTTGLLNHKGISNGRSKLSEYDVLKIRKMYDAGFKQSHLGSIFGVNQTTISCIVLYKNWKHLKHN